MDIDKDRVGKYTHMAALDPFTRDGMSFSVTKVLWLWAATLI